MWVREQKFKLYDNGKMFDISIDVQETKPLTVLNAEAQAAKIRLEAVMKHIKSRAN
jgi:hypothetical protein